MKFSDDAHRAFIKTITLALPTRIKATNRAASWQHVEGQHNGHAVECVVTGRDAVSSGKMLRR